MTDQRKSIKEAATFFLNQNNWRMVIELMLNAIEQDGLANEWAKRNKKHKAQLEKRELNDQPR